MEEMNMPKSEFNVSRYVPRDVHGYSHAAAAVVLLAAALDMDIIEKNNRPLIVRHEGSVLLEIPQNTNLRFNVFRSWVNKLATHATNFALPMEVATKICDVAKLSPDHRRVIVQLAEQSLVPDTTPDEVPVDEPVYVVERKPYLAHSKDGMTYESATSYKRTWSDGHADWECMVCGQAFTTPRGVGAHKQVHIRAGIAEADSADQIRKALLGKDPDWVVSPYGPRPPSEEGVSEPDTPEPEPEPELPDLSDDQEPEVETIADASALLHAAWDALDDYIKAVLLENQQLKNTNRKLRADIAGMISLMQEFAGGVE